MTPDHSRDLPSELEALEPIALPQGTTLFRPGDDCQNFVYIVSGCVRVNLASESGGGLLLYRLTSTDTCVLTITNLLSGDKYSAEAIVESDAVVLTMPARQFVDLLDHSSKFRSFVFSSFSSRLSSLMAKVDEVTFRSIDSRLAESLLYHAKGGRLVEVTHEFLADEIGSVREVISRRLAHWESIKLIARGRKEIQLLDRKQLSLIADCGSQGRMPS